MKDIINKVLPHSSKILVAVIVLICIIIFAVGLKTEDNETASYRVVFSVAPIMVAATGVAVFLASKFLDKKQLSSDTPTPTATSTDTSTDLKQSDTNNPPTQPTTPLSENQGP